MQVALRGQSFEVAEHGSEVFGWAAERGWERFTLDWLDRVLDPQVTFLDIGAWIGVMSLYAAGKCKQVIAVEPDPVAFAVLIENCQGKADLRQMAIAGHIGELELGSGCLGASTTRASDVLGPCTSGRDEKFLSDCLTLPVLVEREELAAPLAIKLDVEGMEDQILCSSLGWLAEHKPDLCVELHPYWWDSPSRMFNTLNELRRIYPVVMEVPDRIAFHA